MAETAPGSDAPSSSYDLIRQRLSDRGRALAESARALNERRQALFGGTPLAVVGTERVRTENNCVPVDIVQVQDRMLFGYNVFVGLRKSIAVADVFALQRVAPNESGLVQFAPASDDEAAFLHDPRFLRDFGALYQYYAETRLVALRTTVTRLFAVFQTGASLDTVKVFQWALGGGTGPTYLDDRGEREVLPPPTHDFEWKETTRDDHVLGRFPHVSIEDVVFVETVGGDLTIKVEDNTEDGHGVYREAVDDPNQSLDDARILYARVGALVLLRIRPYQEETFRHFVFNARTQTVLRVDAIGQSCVRLPEDHGVIFPGGFILQTGDSKVFDAEDADLRYLRSIPSPNGEDVLYVFFRRRDGLYVLFPYNLIRREVQTPIRGHGFSLFDDGRLVVLRAESSEPTRIHPLQIWRTPFVSAEHAGREPGDGSLLSRIGNRDLVRGLSECLTVARLVAEQAPTRAVYEALVKACQRALDGYHWLGDADAEGLAGRLAETRDTSELIIDEFEKVQALRRQAADALAEARRIQEKLRAAALPGSFTSVEQFMEALTSLRTQRGHLITLRDVRSIDRTALDAMEQEIVADFDAVSRATVTFLLEAKALLPLSKRIEELRVRFEGVTRLMDLKSLLAEQGGITAGLEVMSEVVGGLEIEDSSARAAILERLGEVFGQLNRVRAIGANRRKEIAGKEARADFAAEWSLLGQSVSSAVALSESPESCDDQLSRLMLQLEALEARFSEFDEFLPQLATRREEIVEALGARKQVLVDERQRRVGNLVRAAERILDGVKRRARSFKGQDELNAWFASDTMVLKLRDLADQLVTLGDAVKAEELRGRLTASKQDALRGLRDRLDLFEGDAGDLIKLGRHRFAVNTRPLELTLVPRDGGMALHLTGTDFYERIDDAAVEAARPFWEQALPSEGPGVARAEFLAASMLFAAEAGAGLTLAALEAAALRDGGLAELCRTWAGERYDEGYERGVHDHDAARILAELLHLRAAAGLLRFPPRARAAGVLLWASAEPAVRQRWHRRARSFGRLRATLGATAALTGLGEALGQLAATQAATLGLNLPPGEAPLAGRYLVEELQAEHPRFVCSLEAETLAEVLGRHLQDHGGRSSLNDDLALLTGQPDERFALARAWLAACAQGMSGEELDVDGLAVEATVRVTTEHTLDWEPCAAPTATMVPGLLSQHPRIKDGALTLRLDAFLARLTAWTTQTVPAFSAWRTARHAVLERERRRLRLSEFEPRVMSAFVRNQLINEVYLPVVGDNLAKQMGAAGEGRRTDQMGLLLLVSPPGYGKTTLMEYVASRLGLAFMKINGPALGHEVTSLDPAEAPNATARQEVEKINLAFEMANNVMLYLDDIQHTNPELLQKFISLCDATRRVEGVWKGRTRTYDLRGKKFCVVMAGNPYTESGARFRIPDMLANRADTYNLGDILDGREEAFALSYLENALTSNVTLQPLASREPADLYALVRRARGEDMEGTELQTELSPVELSEITSVLSKLLAVQKVILQVNLQYIASAAQEDAFREEPAFKLQGSYRNMNKLAEKIVPAMNDAELDALLRDHYIGEAQTLTTGAESNLLKLWSMLGRQTPEQATRWDDIKREFRRATLRGGKEDDPIARVTGALSGLDRQLEGIAGALVAADGRRELEGEIGEIGKQLALMRAALQGESGEIGQELALMRAALQSEAARVPEPAEPPVAPLLEGLTEELGGIRKAMAGAARGLADISVLEWLAASPGTVRSRPEVARIQKEVLLRAQSALVGSLEPQDDARSALLGGTLPVIQDLFVKIGELLGTVSVSQEEWDSLMGRLRHHVAVAVAELAKAEPGEE